MTHVGGRLRNASSAGRLLLAAGLLLGLTPSALAAPPPETVSFSYSSNMEPVGSSPHQPPKVGEWNSDLAFWGNTAYQGTYNGFRIIDISNPSGPVEVLDYEDCTGSQGDLIIWENLLIRTWDSGASIDSTCGGEPVTPGFEGLHIFDVTNPTAPDLVGEVNIPGCGSHTATGVPDLANNRLLVYSSPSTSCTGFHIVSIPLGDPADPELVGPIPTGRSCHDMGVILGSANLAACAGGNGVTVMSIGGARGGSLTAPVQLWTKDLSGDTVSVGHAATFSWDGRYVLFGHEPGGGGAAACEQADDPRLRTLFLFEAADGKEAGRWVLPRPQTSGENCTIHNFNVVPSDSKRIVVQGNYQAGVAVVDFTNPAQAEEVAYADPAPLPSGGQGGDWSSYWYDGAIYESDMTRGLITWMLDDSAVSSARTLGHLNPQTQELTIPFGGQVPVEKCGGQAVTLLGSVGDDVLTGTPGADVISAGSGSDTVKAGNGNDVVCGGSGNDSLRGGGGNDRLLGQAGRDSGKGGGGTDTFKGGPGKDKGGGFEKGKA